MRGVRLFWVAFAVGTLLGLLAALAWSRLSQWAAYLSSIT